MTADPSRSRSLVRKRIYEIFAKVSDRFSCFFFGICYRLNRFKEMQVQ